MIEPPLGLESNTVWNPGLCPHCNARVWHRLSNVSPACFTEEQFLSFYDIDLTTKKIVAKKPHIPPNNMTVEEITQPKTTKETGLFNRRGEPKKKGGWPKGKPRPKKPVVTV